MVKADIGMEIKMNTKCFKDIRQLAQGKKIDEAPIYDLLAFIDARYDCADFRVVTILKVLYEYPHLISKPTLAAMRESILSFKYWMDEPGDDGMCYWSENHQIIFATCEYLAGQLYPVEIFSNNKMTGRAHQKKAAVRILRWLKQRFQYGFTEWLSNTYYEEDIAALALLIDYCEDEKIVQQATIIMDLLHLDLALHQYRQVFSATSGRAYEYQKKHPETAEVSDIMHHAFGTENDHNYDYEKISAVYVLRNRYQVPQVIKEIAWCDDPLELKQSTGLNLTEIKQEFDGSTDIEDVGMFLWLMEAFTNVESIQMTMDIYREWELTKNNFLKELRPFSMPFLYRWLPNLIKVLNPATQGIAIQRANIYTYRTQHYMMSTVQKYHPGTFGDQQHIWQVNLPKNISVFATHPGTPLFGTAERNFSPSYWVGNGIQPHAVQHKNVGMALYDLNAKKGYLEKERQSFTHLYFPTARFDHVLFEGHLICAQVEESYIGVIGLQPFHQIAIDEFKQKGNTTAYVTVLADQSEYETLIDFLEYLGGCNLKFEDQALTFMDGKNQYVLEYEGEFLLNREVQDTDYDRFDHPFVKAKRKADFFKISYQDETLLLDFEQQRREFGHANR